MKIKKKEQKILDQFTLIKGLKGSICWQSLLLGYLLAYGVPEERAQSIALKMKGIII